MSAPDRGFDLGRCGSRSAGAATLEGHTAWVTACAVTPDGRHVVSASSDKTIVFVVSVVTLSPLDDDAPIPILTTSAWGMMLRGGCPGSGSSTTASGSGT